MDKNKVLSNKIWPEGVPANISGYEQPLFSILDQAIRDYPEETFTIFQGATRTYNQVNETANSIANFLISMGIKKGDRVAIFLPNLPHYPAIFFGILKVGAVCVTCNPIYTTEELNFQLKDSGAKAVFCMDHPEFYPTTVEAIKNTQIETVIICSVKKYLPKIKSILGQLMGKLPKAERYEQGHFFFDEIITRSNSTSPNININPNNDLAIIIYTGGTTGRPKGASLTHSNVNFITHVLDHWALLEHEPGTEREKFRRGGYHCFLGVLPWYHIFGLTSCLLLACHTASRLVCIPDPRSGKVPFTDVIKSIEKYSVTMMSAVPGIFSAITNHSMINKIDCSSLKYCPSGGAPLAQTIAEQFESTTGATIIEGYGLSETSGMACINPTNKEQRKFGSVGLALCNTNVKIVDLETGMVEMAQGEDGEIAINGPQVMQGYWNNPNEDNEIFRTLSDSRYLLSGDIGYINENGFVVINDRKKDMILVGAFNVYPAEVENLLCRHHKVALAAVIGVLDPKGSEKVIAFVQLKPEQEASEEEILEFCKQYMTGYKRPRSIIIRKELPTSVIGKVLRRVLKEEMSEEINTHQEQS